MALASNKGQKKNNNLFIIIIIIGVIAFMMFSGTNLFSIFGNPEGIPMMITSCERTGPVDYSASVEPLQTFIGDCGSHSNVDVRRTGEGIFILEEATGEFDLRTNVNARTSVSGGRTLKNSFRIFNYATSEFEEVPFICDTSLSGVVDCGEGTNNLGQPNGNLWPSSFSDGPVLEVHFGKDYLDPVDKRTIKVDWDIQGDTVRVGRIGGCSNSICGTYAFLSQGQYQPGTPPVIVNTRTFCPDEDIFDDSVSGDCIINDAFKYRTEACPLDANHIQTTIFLIGQITIDDFEGAAYFCESLETNLIIQEIEQDLARGQTINLGSLTSFTYVKNTELIPPTTSTTTTLPGTTTTTFTTTTTLLSCTTEVFTCSDGNTVSRNPALGCAFDLCPTPDVCYSPVQEVCQEVDCNSFFQPQFNTQLDCNNYLTFIDTTTTTTSTTTTILDDCVCYIGNNCAFVTCGSVTDIVEYNTLAQCLNAQGSDSFFEDNEQLIIIGAAIIGGIVLLKFL